MAQKNSGIREGEALTHSFRVSIDGSSSISFESCEGIQSDIEVQYLNDGASMDRVIPVRGRKMGGLITFNAGVVQPGSSSDAFFNWYQQVCDSSVPLKKKLLTVSLLDAENGDKVLTAWEVNGAWPCRWHGPLLATSGAKTAIQQLCFAYESIQKKKPKG